MSSGLAEGTALGRLEAHNELIKSGNHTVQPGQPQRFSEAAVENDTIAQGDLYLIVREGGIPEGYTEGKTVVQLVPGQTQGAKHCLDSVEGVTMYFPKNWNEADLAGPIFVADREVEVLHPVHGNVTIPAGFMIECRYQREWDAELARERRNAD